MKWRLKSPSAGSSFSEAAKVILTKRLKLVIKSIRIYFRNENAENLHEVRISIRRLRYSLEVFFSCIEKNIFTSFYKRIEHLQDLSGEVRDIDVLKQNILGLNSKVKMSSFTDKLDKKRFELNEQLRLELMKFIHSKEIKEFRNKLK